MEATGHGNSVPVRLLREQHVRDDLGWIPTFADWIRHLDVQPWMRKSGARLEQMVLAEETKETNPAPTDPFTLRL